MTGINIRSWIYALWRQVTFNQITYTFLLFVFVYFAYAVNYFFHFFYLRIYIAFLGNHKDGTGKSENMVALFAA